MDLLVRTKRALSDESWWRRKMECARRRSWRTSTAGFTSLEEYSTVDSGEASLAPGSDALEAGSLVRSIDYTPFSNECDIMKLDGTYRQDPPAGLEFVQDNA